MSLKKFQFNENTGIDGSESKQYKLNNCKGNVDTTLQHLPPCQMIRYDPVPLPPPLDLPKCVPPAHKMQFA